MTARRSTSGTSKSNPAKSADDAANRPAAPPAAPVRPTVVTEISAVVAEPALKKQELLASVIERSGVKKKFAKPVVEALLAELGEAVGEGREFNLEPFGKLKQVRTTDQAKARVVTARIRQRKPDAKEDNAEAKEALAKRAEGR